MAALNTRKAGKWGDDLFISAGVLGLKQGQPFELKFVVKDDGFHVFSKGRAPSDNT